MLCLAAVLCSVSWAADNAGKVLKLPLRSRVELFKGSGDWQAVEVSRGDPRRAARRWSSATCGTSTGASGATSRVGSGSPAKRLRSWTLARERGC